MMEFKTQTRHSETSSTSATNTELTFPKEFLRKIGIARLEFTKDHYDVFQAYTRTGEPIYLVAKAAEDKMSELLRVAVVRADLWYASEPQLIYRIGKAIGQRIDRRGLLKTTSGWVDESFKSYVFGDTIIGAHSRIDCEDDAGSSFVLACPSFDSARNFNLAGPHSTPPDSRSFKSIKGTWKSWRYEVPPLAACSSPCLIAIGAAFAGPLLRLCRQDSFMLMFVDMTSGGKTTVTVGCGSVIGIGSSHELPNWRATEAALEGLTGEYSDSVFPVDELSHAGDSKKIFKLVDQASYWVGGGAVTAKHERSTSAIARKPVSQQQRSLILLTSYERSLSEVEHSAGTQFREGVRVRTIEIPCALGGDSVGVVDGFPEDSDTAENDPVQFAERWVEELSSACRENHGAMFKKWVSIIASDPELARKMVEKGQLEFKQHAQYNHDSRIERRHLKPFAFIYGSLYLASEWSLLGLSRVAIRNSILKLHRLSLAQLRERHLPLEAALETLIAQLSDKSRIVLKGDLGDYGLETRDGWLELEAGLVIFRVKSSSFRSWFDNGAMRDAVERHLLEAHVLRKDSRGNRTKQVRAPDGTRQQVYQLAYTRDKLDSRLTKMLEKKLRI
jgi:hypothetical protein